MKFITDASQLPFGSVPFRHVIEEMEKFVNAFVSITFRLSALSARRLDASGSGPAKYVSITFRLSALSARCYPSGGRLCEGSVSITFRLSALSAQDLPIYVKKADRKVGLNYLSAQCPFGTEEMRPEIQATGESVSITFRLSALSAQELP